MRRILLASILLAVPVLLAGQEIRIEAFKSITDVPARVVYDFDGHPCAVLRMETDLAGWCFDAGLSGIVDVCAEEGHVDVYLSADARTITVAREGCKPLREWAFPEPLKAGRTYWMRLEQGYSVRGRTQQSEPYYAKPAPAPPVVKPVQRLDDNEFCRSFLTLQLGFDFEEVCSASLRYTRINDRIGPYFGLGVNYDGGGMFLCGAAFRLTDESRTGLDLQYYLGVGIGSPLTIDTGIRFAFRSDLSLSSWDFGFGVQFCGDGILPTVELGFLIWGIPVLLGLRMVLGG
jgi:hypothetical protein